MACRSQRHHWLSRPQLQRRCRGRANSQAYQRHLFVRRRSQRMLWGLLGDLLYLNAQAGTGERSGLVSKVDRGLQQCLLGEFFGFLPNGSKDPAVGWICWLDLDTLIWANRSAYKPTTWQSMRLRPQLVDQFAEQLTTPSSNLRTLIQQNIVNKLSSLNGQNPSLPVAPIASTEPGKIRDAVQQLIQSQEPELIGAIRTGVEN